MIGRFVKLQRLIHRPEETVACDAAFLVSLPSHLLRAQQVSKLILGIAIVNVREEFL